MAETRKEVVRAHAGRLRRLARPCVRWLACTVLVCQLLAICGWLGLPWPFELFGHWIPLGGLASLALFPLALWVRLRKIAATLAASSAFAFLVLWPCLIPNTTLREPSGSTLDVITCNLCEHNEDHDRAAAWLLERDPDVIALLEFEPESLDALADVILRYPYRILHPLKGPRGFALLSRVAIVEHEVYRLGIISQLDAVLSTDAGPVRFLLAHPYAHTTLYRLRESLRTLEEIARRSRESSLPVILAGDLNLTPWCPSFLAFLSESALRDPRPGLGVFNTWPVLPWNDAIDVVGIPIDHVLTSPMLRVVELRRGPANGSDHRPLEAIIDLGTGSIAGPANERR